jgi:hypothetical protein
MITSEASPTRRDTSGEMLESCLPGGSSSLVSQFSLHFDGTTQLALEDLS